MADIMMKWKEFGRKWFWHESLSLCGWYFSQDSNSALSRHEMIELMLEEPGWYSGVTSVHKTSLHDLS
jgi:hypothetical protein